MECPNCKEKYKFSEVPFEHRKMNALVTEFVCPYCGIWITPGKPYKFLLLACIVLTIASVTLIILGVYTDPDFQIFGFGLAFISFLLFILSNFILTYEIKN